MGTSTLSADLPRTHLSLIHPSLFEGLILLDPVIQDGTPSRPYAVPSAYRRDVWPPRQHAADRFLASPFYQAWDSRVFEKWVTYGLRNLPTKSDPSPSSQDLPTITLTTPKAQKQFTSLRSVYIDQRSGIPRGIPSEEMYPDDIDDFPFYRPEPRQILERLPDLKPGVLHVFGSESALSSPSARLQRMVNTGTGVGGSGGASKERAKEVVLSCGHLVPMERVQETASHVTFLECLGGGSSP